MWKICQDPTDHGQHLIVMTGHCSVWLYGCHSQPVSYSSKTGCQIDVSTRTIRNRLKSAGLKSSKCLPPKWSLDLCSLASPEPGFESHTAYLGHVRPSCTGSGTSCAKHSSVGSSIASGMAAAITTGHSTSNWRDETQGWGRHSSTWGLHPVLNVEQLMSSSDS
jgi:hypothetical protein